ncbi:hypothetical protein THOM_1175 [Trachipleistophora hominis]|uniref:Uncharacterized protein n=1 Tax=Trachipleistophora hominis TaxID=72359 RepID=L7JXT1_TRAHO|nr:hypothetical protein THOM_1175 [Trachipleistophora hominis]
MNSLPATHVFNTCTCHEMNSLPATHVCTDPYATIQRNRALLNRTLMIENIMADRKQRYIKSVHEHFDSLVGQYHDALQGWEVERCIGVKKEIFKVWTMIRKWNRAG